MDHCGGENPNLLHEKELFHEGFSPRRITLTRVDNFGYSPTQWPITFILYRKNKLQLKVK